MIQVRNFLWKGAFWLVEACVIFLCALTWSVKGVVGVEDCCEEAEGERSDAKRHVKTRVTETLEHLCTGRKPESDKQQWDYRTHEWWEAVRLAYSANIKTDLRLLDSLALSSVPVAAVAFSTWTKAVGHKAITQNTHTEIQARSVPGVLLAGAPPSIQWDDFLSADARFTHRTLLPAWPRLQPLRGAADAENISRSEEPVSAASLCQPDYIF